MTDRLDDVWSGRDFPVLLVIARKLESGEEYMFEAPIAAETGLERAAVIRAVAALSKAGYIDARLLEAAGGTLSATVVGITERGMREVGLWPSPEAVADRLIAALEQAMAAVPEGSEKHGRLRSIRDGFVAIGRDLTVELAGAAITGRLGM